MTIKEIMNVFADEDCFAVQNTIVRLHYFTEDEFAEECTSRKNYRSYMFSHKCRSFDVADYIAHNVDDLLDEETIYNFIHTSEDAETIYIDCQVVE